MLTREDILKRYKRSVKKLNNYIHQEVIILHKEIRKSIKYIDRNYPIINIMNRNEKIKEYFFLRKRFQIRIRQMEK